VIGVIFTYKLRMGSLLELGRKDMNMLNTCGMGK
jgi:hypothetical protein